MTELLVSAGTQIVHKRAILAVGTSLTTSPTSIPRTTVETPTLMGVTARGVTEMWPAVRRGLHAAYPIVVSQNLAQAGLLFWFTDS